MNKPHLTIVPTFAEATASQQLLPEPQRALAKQILYSASDLHNALQDLVVDHEAANWAQIVLRGFATLAVEIHNGSIDHAAITGALDTIRRNADDYAHARSGVDA